tara:strand:- start:9660 stop:10454 length:795 start_codon:yes stop_codon:yes gene_type:complete
MSKELRSIAQTYMSMLQDDYDPKKDHDMNPTSHVSKNKDTGMFCVYDINGKKVAEFKTKDEADAYAKKNHDALMKKEEVEIDEVKIASKNVLGKDNKAKKQTGKPGMNKFRAGESPFQKRIKKITSEMDPVNKDAVKKKFDDRKDKDIDNDGDVDSSDKFLHKRRKAISKSMKGESTVLKSYVDIMQEEKAKASHAASPKAAEVEPEENPDLPKQPDMAPNTKKVLDMHRKGEKRDYPADKNKTGGEKMKQAPKPKTLKDLRSK